MLLSVFKFFFHSHEHGLHKLLENNNTMCVLPFTFFAILANLSISLCHEIIVSV
jgi:hypothetical protein